MLKNSTKTLAYLSDKLIGFFERFQTFFEREVHKLHNSVRSESEVQFDSYFAVQWLIFLLFLYCVGSRERRRWDSRSAKSLHSKIAKQLKAHKFYGHVNELIRCQDLYVYLVYLFCIIFIMTTCCYILTTRSWYHLFYIITIN